MTKVHPSEIMRAVTWQSNGVVSLELVGQPMLDSPTDAIIKITSASICGSDLHLYHGAIPKVYKGDILGHEAMGIVYKVGDQCSLKVGDRVVVSCVVSCGSCSYCKEGKYSLCNTTNPNEDMKKMYGQSTAALFGYSHLMGGLPGCQAEYVRVPFADVNCLQVPPSLADDQVLFLSDVVCTAWHACELGQVKKGDVVGVWGCGPIGLMAARLCFLRGASKVYSIDQYPERLKVAASIGAIPVNFVQDVPNDYLLKNELEGLDVCIDAVGFRYAKSWKHSLEQALYLETDSIDSLSECIHCCKKGGVVSIVGDYVGYCNHYPVGKMMEKGLTVRGSQVFVQKYWKYLLSLIENGSFDPRFVISHQFKLEKAKDAYKLFDDKAEGALKILLKP